MTESRPIPGWETAASSRDPGSFCPLVPGGAEEACGPGDAVAGGRRSENRDLQALCGKLVLRATKPQRNFVHFCGRDLTSGSVGKDAKGPVCGARPRGTSVSRAT